MSFKRLFWGIGLISLGALYLVSIITGNTVLPELMYKLWPLLLILIGAAYLVKNEKARYIISGVGGLVFAIVVFSFLHKPWHCMSFDSHDDAEKELKVSTYSRKYDSTVKSVSIDLRAGAGAFVIGADSSNLISLYQKKDGIRFIVDTLFTDSSANFTIETKDVEFKFGGKNNHDNSLYLKLHPAPAYRFNIDIGAASAEFDFSKLLTEEIDLEVGAASLTVKLGEPAQRTADVNIEAGASSLSISFPKTVGVELETDMALSSKALSGLNSEGENLYRSEGFQNAQKKIYLRVNGGVSSLAISQY